MAIALIKRAYGKGPDKLYFVGSSEAGRKGLTMARRYQADFDGVFLARAGHQLGGIAARRLEERLGDDG